MSPKTTYSLFPVQTPSRISTPNDQARSDKDETGSIKGTDYLGASPRSAEEPSTSSGGGIPFERARSPIVTLRNEADSEAVAKASSATTDHKTAPPTGITVDEPQAMRSMFPAYDDDRPLDKQWYLPSQMSPSAVPFETVCKSPYSAVFDSTDKMKEGPYITFETVGVLENDGVTPEWELPGMWRLADGDATDTGPPVCDYRLRMHYHETPKAKKQHAWTKGRAEESTRILSCGSSTATPFLTVSTVDQAPCNTSTRMRSTFKIQTHGLTRLSPGSTTPTDTVADFSIQMARARDHVSVTPVHGDIETEVITSFLPRHDNHVASEEPEPAGHSVGVPKRASSKDLERQRCYVVLRTSHGSRHVEYALKHPKLGFMRLKTQGNVHLPRSPPEGEGVELPALGRIELLVPIKDDEQHEEASSVKYKSTLNDPEVTLAYVDLAQSTLFLDGAAFRDVGEPNLAEAAISSLLAVMLAETHHPRLSQKLTFAPPPTTEIEVQRKGSRLNPLARRQRPNKPSKKEKVENEVELALSTMFGLVALALEPAVDRLATLNDRVKS